MSSQTLELSTAASAILRQDFLRRSPSTVGGRGGHKEWNHFCVVSDAINVLVNFFLADDVRTCASTQGELGRLTVLVQHHGSWEGNVETFAPEEILVRGGRIDLALGGNRLRFQDGVYRLEVVLRDQQIEAQIELRPLTLPSSAPSIPLPGAFPLRWVIVPRLGARGYVRVHGQTHSIDGALAYHDHNWGHFLWGDRFSWVWGFSLPLDTEVPWSVVFVQLANRHRTTALTQGMFLWREKENHRLFRDRDVELTFDRELLQPARVFKVPRIMSLLHPDIPTDVPRRIVMEARADGDWVCCEFHAKDLAQVIIPNETDFDVTLINEVMGGLHLHGEIGGERIDVRSHGICEFLGR